MFYSIIAAILSVLRRVVFRTRVEGRENVPKDGPLIICANHIHFIDPVIIIATTKRPVRFLAKKELFANRFFAFILRKMKVIPLDREGNDMEAFRTAVETLKNGRALGIFAQGARMKDIDVKSAKSGVALFALKCNATVVPAYIEGSFKPFSKLVLRYGEPLDFSEYAGQKLRTELLEKVTETIMLKITELSAA